MTEHPTAVELEGLVRGELTRDQARSVVRHLLRGCESCVAHISPYAAILLDGTRRSAGEESLEPAQWAQLARLAHESRRSPLAAHAQHAASGAIESIGAIGSVAPTPATSPMGSMASAPPAATPLSSAPVISPLAAMRPARPVPAPTPEPSQDGAEQEAAGAELLPDLADRTLVENAYDRAIDRAFAAVMRHGENAARVSARVREVLAQLTAEGLEGLRELPAELGGFSGYEALLDRSWSLRRDDPKQMVRLAELATVAAAGLGAEGFSDGQVRDFQARAAVELSNAYRVMDRLPDAQESLDAARLHFRAGSQDRLLGARMLEVQANIDGDRHEFDRAFAALDGALKIYRRYGDPHLAGRSLIKKGLYTAHAGRQQDAIELLTEGLEMIDPRQDAPLALAAVHNTAYCLVGGGRYREARSLLWRHLALYEKHAGRQDRLKLRWLQAQIYSGLGDNVRAARALEEVRVGLQEAGRVPSQAMATLELAELYLRHGDEETARAWSREASELIRGLDLSPEASAALEQVKASLQRPGVAIAELLGEMMQLVRDVAPDERPSLSARSA